MKKRYVIILFIFILIFFGSTVKAATFKVSASKTQVSPNETFSVSVGGDCIGRVNISVTNGTPSTSSVWVEQGYQTVTIKAGSTGSVTVTATPTAGFSDADANEYKPGSKSVKVTIVSSPTTTPSEKPNTTPNTRPGTNTTNNNSNKTTNNNNTNNNTKNPVKNEQTVTEEKSSNNLLSSLNINTGTLVPNFDTNINEYSVDLSKDIKTISISAEPQDGKARIEGKGEIELNPGENIINIKVIAENNEERIYKIKAYAYEEPEVYLKYKEKEIGVVKNLRNVSIPEGFNKKEHTVDNRIINIFEGKYFSIIYGVDSEQNNNFYIIDTEKNECINKIIPMTIANRFFYLIDLEEKEGFEISTHVIEEKEIPGYKFKDGFENYFLISVMNSNGEKLDYLYEQKEGTLQLYSGSAPIEYNNYKELIKDTNTKQIIIYILSGFLAISIICISILILKLRKGKMDEKV